MPYLLLWFSLFLAGACAQKPSASPPPPALHYVAWGDSYTIGTAIGEDSSYAAMLARHLAQEHPGLRFYRKATNGWTTGDLLSGLNEGAMAPRADLLSLLIGVNNQYRSLPLADYRRDMRKLLAKADSLTGGRRERILVLGIPDYGVTLNENDERASIGREIDRFNAAQKALCDSLGLRFIDITSLSRQAAQRPEWIAADQLHFSAALHRAWLALILAPVEALDLP